MDALFPIYFIVRPKIGALAVNLLAPPIGVGGTVSVPTHQPTTAQWKRMERLSRAYLTFRLVAPASYTSSDASGSAADLPQGVEFSFYRREESYGSGCGMGSGRWVNREVGIAIC